MLFEELDAYACQVDELFGNGKIKHGYNDTMFWAQSSYGEDFYFSARKIPLPYGHGVLLTTLIPFLVDEMLVVEPAQGVGEESLIEPVMGHFDVFAESIQKWPSFLQALITRMYSADTLHINLRTTIPTFWSEKDRRVYAYNVPQSLIGQVAENLYEESLKYSDSPLSNLTMTILQHPMNSKDILVYQTEFSPIHGEDGANKKRWGCRVSRDGMIYGSCAGEIWKGAIETDRLLRANSLPEELIADDACMVSIGAA